MGIYPTLDGDIMEISSLVGGCNGTSPRNNGES
jgi:hypothetical protein